MKIYVWISITIVALLVAFAFIPMWNQYGFVPTNVAAVNGEILVSGSIGMSTKNMYDRTIKMTRKASFMQCSLDETKGLEEAIHISTHPDLYNHNHIVDIAVTDHLKVTLSDVTTKKQHQESTIAIEYVIAQITCFDEDNQMAWETILDGSNDTYGSTIVLYNDLIYVAGSTHSPDFPVKNAFQETLVGASNFFLSCFDLQGNMVWSTFINGTTDSLITSLRCFTKSPLYHRMDNVC